MKRSPAVLLALLLVLPHIVVAGEWVQETIDLQEDRQFSYPQIVIDAQGTSHVLYHDGTNWGIRYAANDGSGWQAEIVDEVGMLAPVYGLAVSDVGAPFVGFRGATGYLEYAVRQESGWATARIDSTGTLAKVSACMGSGGMPLFAYVMDDVLRLASWTGTAYEISDIGGIADCDYLRLRVTQLGVPVIGALDGDSGALRVYTGVADLSSWTLDDDLVVSNLGNGWAFDLDTGGSPHWCYYNTSLRKVVISSNTGTGWVDEALTTPTILYDNFFDFHFDVQGNPGLVINGQYAHWEGGEWIWRTTDLMYVPYPASLGFHPGGNATIVCANMALTWWEGQPVLVLPETGHVWEEAYAQWDLTIENDGDMPLIIDEIDYLSGPAAVFPVLGTTFPLTVQPGGAGSITFDFQPAADGTYHAEVELSTNDPVAPTATISLEGTYTSTTDGGVKPILVTNLHADMVNKRLVGDLPLAGAEVTLLSGAVPAYGPLVTSADGTLSFTGVAPGTYTIMAVNEFPDPEDSQVTRSVTARIQNIVIAEGLNSQAEVVLPDSLMQQAYRATYYIEGMGRSDLMTFDYPAASEARQVLADLGQDLSSPERIQSVSRLMLACDASGMMFYDASRVGSSFIAGLGNLTTFLFYSNNWLDSIIEIIQIMAKAITDKLGALLDSIIMIAKILLRFVVQASVDYALSFLPCDQTDLVCVRDVGKAAWNGMNSAFGGFGIGAFSYDEWDYFVDKAEELLVPVFYQFAYIDHLTNPDLESAIDRSAEMDFTSTFDYVAPRTYQDLEANAVLTGQIAEFCDDLLVSAQLMYATAMVFDAMKKLPYLGILGTVGDIMDIAAWVSLGTSLGTSGGVYFTQPGAMGDLIDDIYAPDKSASGAVDCLTVGGPLTSETKALLESGLKAAADDYAAVIGDVRTAVQDGDAETAATALVDLAAADQRWMKQSELARAPVYAVAARARDAHGEFSAQYDTLLARNTAVGAEHLKTYLGVLALSADEKGDISDYILGQLDANVAANTAFGDHMSTILETVSDLPVPAIVAAAEVSQSADRMAAGRIDTLTIRLTNLGGVVAADVDLVLRTSANLGVVGTDSLRIASLAAGAQSAEYVFFVRPVGADANDGLWTLDIGAPDAWTYSETGLFLAVPVAETPATGGALKSENVYNYPNPFNPDDGPTTLRFSLAEDAAVSVRIYDAGNRLVRELVRDAAYTAQEEIGIDWDGLNGQGDIVANGVYFAVIESNRDERAVGKIAVLR